METFGVFPRPRDARLRKFAVGRDLIEGNLSIFEGRFVIVGNGRLTHGASQNAPRGRQMGLLGVIEIGSEGLFVRFLLIF